MRGGYLESIPFFTIYSFVVFMLAGKRLPGPAGKQNFWSVFAGSVEQIKVSQQVEKLLQKVQLLVYFITMIYFDEF